MARQRFVTRTVKKTVAVIAGVNLLDNVATNVTMEIPYKITDEKKILKLAKAKYDSEIFVCAKVIDINFEDTVLGIPEETFMEYAVEITR